MSFHRILRSNVVGFYAINGRQSWAGVSAGDAFRSAFAWWLHVIGETPYTLYEDHLKWWPGGTGEFPELKTLRRWATGPITHVRWDCFGSFVQFMWDHSRSLVAPLPLTSETRHIDTNETTTERVPDPRFWIPGRLLPNPWEESKPAPHTYDHPSRMYCLWCWPYAPHAFGGYGLIADPLGAVMEVLAAYAALQLKHIPFDEKEFARRLSGNRAYRETDDVFADLQVAPEDLVMVLRQKGWIEWCSYPKKPPTSEMFGRTKRARGGVEPFFRSGADKDQWNAVGYAMDNPDAWKSIRDSLDEAETPETLPAPDEIEVLPPDHGDDEGPEV